MGKVFGIDLGTTYSCIAFINEFEKPEVLKNSEGDLTTPSVVFFESSTEVTVGAAAKSSSKLYPDKVVSLIKREMGKSDISLTFNGVDMRPEEISSYILKKVVQDGEDTLRMTQRLGDGEHIRDVVITCPAYFGVPEREATRTAGKIAGLNVLDVINEPTAAAITYGVVDDGKSRTVLVYDLGGGTFDVTMIHIQPGEKRVICTGGDHNLGGYNWDERIITYAAEQYRLSSKVSESILDDLETLQELSLSAEQAKKLLTSKEKAKISASYKGERVSVELTREKFEELTEDLLDRTISLTREMFKEAEKKNFRQSDIDIILLVGGSSKMPQIMRRVSAEFGIETKMFDPDESVAKGAAIFAHKLAHKPAGGGFLPEDNMKIINVSSRSFGTEALESSRSNQLKLFNIILRNAELPATGTNTFYPLADNQRSVRFTVKESLASEEVVDTSLGEEIGSAVLTLPEGVTQDTQIEVTFQLDESGLLHLHAMEKKEGRVVEAEFQTMNALSEAELQDAMSRSSRSNVN